MKIINCLFIPEIEHTLILGVDFWTSMRIFPDFKRNCWFFSNTVPCILSVISIMSRAILTLEQKDLLDNLINKYLSQQENKLVALL